MTIVISTTGSDLDSQIDQRFGRCAYFLIVDGKKVKKVQNPGAQAMGGAGIAAAQIIVDQKVDAIITGNIGPNALNVLQVAGIKVFQVSLDMKAKQALKAYQKQELKEIKGIYKNLCSKM